MTAGPEVFVAVVRRVDHLRISYVRECREDDLDHCIAAEQNEAGTIVSMVISQPDG